jgi:3-oxoacyl-[acyl-carrier protein] reductase
MMNLSIKEKNALVAGSTQGIGKATAELLIREGCKVTICSRNIENLEKAASDIENKTGIKPFISVCDINNPDDISDVVNKTKMEFGSIDILVNNCGGPIPGTFDQLSDSDWNNAVEQVLLSAVRMTRAILPEMKKNNSGRIINITSLSVKQPVDNLLLSNALRSAVTAFAKTLSNDIGKNNITVNNVAPGYTLTSRLQELAVVRAGISGKNPDNVLKEMASNVPLKRLAEPEEVAAVVVFLASEQAGYITGTTVPVDGGVIKSTY